MFIFQEFLTEIFFTFSQTGVFQDSLQYHFTPVSLHLGISFQGTSQVVGIVANLFVQLHQFLDTVFQRKALLGLFIVHFFHLMLEFFQILSERFQQITQGFRTKPVECLRLLLENPVGHILKLRIQLLP